MNFLISSCNLKTLSAVLDTEENAEVTFVITITPMIIVTLVIIVTLMITFLAANCYHKLYVPLTSRKTNYMK